MKAILAVQPFGAADRNTGRVFWPEHFADLLRLQVAVDMRWFHELALPSPGGVGRVGRFYYVRTETVRRIGTWSRFRALAPDSTFPDGALLLLGEADESPLGRKVFDDVGLRLADTARPAPAISMGAAVLLSDADHDERRVPVAVLVEEFSILPGADAGAIEGACVLAAGPAALSRWELLTGERVRDRSTREAPP